MGSDVLVEKRLHALVLGARRSRAGLDSIQVGLVVARIELREKVSPLDFLALGHRKIDQLSGNLERDFGVGCRGYLARKLEVRADAGSGELDDLDRSSHRFRSGGLVSASETENEHGRK